MPVILVVVPPPLAPGSGSSTGPPKAGCAVRLGTGAPMSVWRNWIAQRPPKPQVAGPSPAMLTMPV